MSNWLTAGTIVNAHGIRGEIKLNPVVEPELLVGCSMFRIQGVEQQPKHLHVHKGMLLFSLDGVTDMDAALAYKGKKVEFDKESLHLKKDVYFDEELVGCNVVDADNSCKIGIVQEVLLYPAHKVLQVLENGKEYLIPLVFNVFIETIDLSTKTISVHMMEGLETNAD